MPLTTAAIAASAIVLNKAYEEIGKSWAKLLAINLASSCN
jgi:hypothetical protein